MGLTKRRESFYVEFPVLDDGKTITLARGVPRAKLKRWKVGNTNRTIAKQQEALIKTELMKGLVKSNRLHGPMTFKALAESYLEAPEIKRQSNYRGKEATVRNLLLPVFGDRLIDSITPAMIEAYREQRRMHKGVEGTTVKIATINRDLALFKHILGRAVRDGLLEKNPVRLVKLEKEDNARDRVLTQEEFEALQDHSAPHVQAVNLMACQTGMRCGEILNLTWDKVDLKAGLIRLKGEDTKTRDGRVIPLTQELTARLKELYKVRYIHEPHVFLVDGKSIGSIKTAFKNACRRAGVVGFRFHDFRHTAVTNMRRAGIDHLTVMRITGHKTLTVFKRYNSFAEGDLREAASRYNTYLTLAKKSSGQPDVSACQT